MSEIPMMIVTGPVGVGKTSVAAEVSELLAAGDVPHALVDLDWLGGCFPSPPDDPFNTRLALLNLSAVWANYHAAGARRLVVAAVVESREDVRRCAEAAREARPVVVRLAAALTTLQRRVEVREVGSGREWHLRRAAELAPQMARDAVEDVLVDTDGKSVVEVAREVLERTRWADALRG